MQLQFDQHSFEVIKHLCVELSKARKQSKQKQLFRSKYGDSVAKVLLDRGCQTDDQWCQKTQVKFNLGGNSQFFFTMIYHSIQELGLIALDHDFIVLEGKVHDLHMKDEKTCFMEMFAEKMRHDQKFRQKLINSSTYTHVSMALRQSGMNRDVFQIGVLLFKSQFSVSVIYESTEQEGAIISGRVLDSAFKPCFAVLNRDSHQQRCIIGPNRIYYDVSDGDEYKIFVPMDYLRMPRHPLLSCEKPIIELYGTKANNMDVKLGNQMSSFDASNDINSNEDPMRFQQQGIELAHRNFMIPSIDIKKLCVSMNEALQTSTPLLNVANKSTGKAPAFGGGIKARLENRLNQGSNVRASAPFQPTTAQSSQAPQIRKTKAQIMREKQAAEKLSNPPSAFSASNNHFNSNQGSQGFGSSRIQPPSFQPLSSKTRWQPPSAQKEMQKQSMANPFERQNLNCTFAADSSQSASPFGFGQQQNAQQRRTSFLAQSMNRVSITPNQQQQQQQPTSWQIPTATSMPSFQPQNSMPAPNFNFTNTQQPQNSKPKFQFQNPVQQTAFMPTQPTFANQSMLSTSGVTQQNISNMSKFEQTPLPVRFSVNGVQSKRFDSKKSHSDGRLLSQQTQFEMKQQQLTFYDLSEQDQEFLKKCLNDLVQELNVSQQDFEGARNFMLTKPMEFFKHYQYAIDVSRADSKKVEQNIAAEKEEKPLLQMSSFTDIHLFMINVAERLYPSSKFKDSPHCIKDILCDVSNPDNDTSPEKGLELLVLASTIPRNDGFAKLYKSRQQPYDMVLHLNGKKFRCHQFVLSQSCSYMRDAVHRNQKIDIEQFGKPQAVQTFELPQWVSEPALENYIRFSYTSEFKMQQTGASALRKERPKEALELFRLACYFYCESLQECLVAREIIPNMNSNSAVQFLNELFSRDQPYANKREPSVRARHFLQDYCMFYLARHLPVILRQDKLGLRTLPKVSLYEIIKHSMYYIVDARADLEIILEFYAGICSESKDVYSLFETLTDRMSKCCGFDQQRIPQITQIKTTDSETPYSVELIEGFNYGSLKQPEYAKGKNRLRDSCALDSSALMSENEKQGAKNVDTSTLQAEKQFGPAGNVLIFADGQTDTGPINNPSFQLEIDLSEAAVSQHLKEGSPGLSFFSSAFDVARRSWHLKIDIAKPSNDISIWVVERGQTTSSTEVLHILQRSLPIKFTSQLMELQIVDPGLKHRKSVIFFSYAHDQNQVIGHRNFANLEQLTNKQSLKVEVKIVEHIIHSAMMHHTASTFQRRFREECALEQTKKIYDQNSYQRYQQVQNSTGIFAQPVHIIFWLLSSDILKVEDENTVLSFIFHYANLMKDRTQSQEQAILAVDQLAKCLRYNFCDLHNLLSAIRKSSSIQGSIVMNDSFKREVKARMSIKKPAFSLIDPQVTENENPELEHHFCGRARKYFSESVDQQGRNKLVKNSRDVNVALMEEMTQWAFQSRIQELSDKQKRAQPYQLTNQQHQSESAQVRYITAQLQEERSKLMHANQQLQEYKRKYEATLVDKNRYPMRQYSPPRSNNILGALEDKENMYQHAQKQRPQTEYSNTSVPINNNLYAQPKSSVENGALGVKRDPPSFLAGATKRNVPSMLNNHNSLPDKSLNSDRLQFDLQKKHDPTKINKPNSSLNLSNITSGNMKRDPPVSIADPGLSVTNKSVNLSAIMAQINSSPAPKPLQRRNGAANYLAKRDGNKNDCTIF